MKITVIGSHLCPDTLYALNQLAAAGAEVSFQDILSCHAALLTYLNIRGTQRLGVPCFQREDGSLTLELKDILD